MVGRLGGSGVSGGGSLGRDYFDALYAERPDPWELSTSDYEKAKYADTLAALDGRRFRSAAEVGCAIGELTAVLAPSCDAYLGVDVAEAALAQARRRNADAPHVRFERLAFPDEAPAGSFDLIVLSEVLYYFSRADLARVAAWVERALTADGVVLAVHWLGETPDYPLTGDQAAEVFLQLTAPALTIDRQLRRAHYRLERLVRPA